MSHGGRHGPVVIVNDHHADDLLTAARALGGHPDATAARPNASTARHSPRPAGTRVGFAEPVADGDPSGLRVPFADLARRANAAPAAGGAEPGAP